MVIGAGFAGLEVARELGRAGVDVCVVDRHNHHTFQPLLYQVATAALSAPDIAEPIRKNLRDFPSGDRRSRRGGRHRLAGQAGDLADREAIATIISSSPPALDRLLRPRRLGRPGAGPQDDRGRRAIRSRLLLTFERAEHADDPAERARLMTIAVIGGGPTGVELAGSIAELSRYTLARDFRNIRPESTRVC